MKFKRDIILWTVAVFLLLSLSGYTIYAVNFLAKEINLALLQDLTATAPLIRFDCAGANEVLAGRLSTTTPLWQCEE